MGGVAQPQAQTTRIISSAMYGIDAEGNDIIPVPGTAALPDLEAYLTRLLSEIASQDHRRGYKLQSSTTEFGTCLTSLYTVPDLDTNPSSRNLAERLLRTEVATLARYRNLNKVSSGSFLQFIYLEHGLLSFLGVKVEHLAFLDVADFIRKIGLPDERKLYKACKVSFLRDGTVGEVSVFDTNGVPAQYWCSEFLELEPVRDDTENTKKAVEAVLQAIGPLKRRHPADHTILRNATVAAFKRNIQMNYHTFVSDTFGAYTPVSSDASADIVKLVAKLNLLPNTKGFDTQFTLVPEAVPFRQKKYNLTPEIMLTVREGIADLSEKIWAETTQDGKKVVVIETDQADNFVMKPR